MDVRTTVADVVLRRARECGGSFPGPIDDGTALADTGLDSLGFASVMMELEKKLGHDPFGDADEIVYPETFGELVTLYQDGE